MASPSSSSPHLISAQLSSEPATAPARPQAIWLTRYLTYTHTHTLTRIYTHTRYQVIFVLIFECLIQKPVHKCKVHPCVFTQGNPEIHLTRVTCQNLFYFIFCGCETFCREIWYNTAEAGICSGARNSPAIILSSTIEVAWLCLCSSLTR